MNREESAYFMNDLEKYPKHWWTAFPETKAFDWEILPQAAEKGSVILSKRNELGLLSNFAATPFELDGVRYASLEGFWQMLKFPDLDLVSDPRQLLTGIDWKYSREAVGQMLGFDAVLAGDHAETIMQEHSIDWVSYRGSKMMLWDLQRGEHYDLIRRATVAKLEQNPAVQMILQATGDLTLCPDHHQPSVAPPAWRYFEIYMELREQLFS